MICHPEFSLFFPWATAIVVLQKNEAGIYISPLIELACRHRTAQVDILLNVKTIRFYLDRFLISSTSTTPKCTLHFNFDRPQTGLPCDCADRACYSNITADHFYSVSAKKPNCTLIKWSTAHHFQFQGEFLGNLHQCCNSFTWNKIVSYIKAEDGPVFTVRYYVI